MIESEFYKNLEIIKTLEKKINNLKKDLSENLEVYTELKRQCRYYATIEDLVEVNGRYIHKSEQREMATIHTDISFE